MASEQELNKTSPLHKEFQTLLEKDFKDRKLVANQVIKAKIDRKPNSTESVCIYFFIPLLFFFTM